MHSATFKTTIGQSLSEKLKVNVHIKNFTPIVGGCINDAQRMDTTAGVFFIKWNDAKKYPGMFEAEARGLSLLRSARTLKVPEVILSGEAEEKSFLILEYIEGGRKQKDFWQDFGYNLAKMHQAPLPPKGGFSPSFGGVGEAFGLNHDNYIGSLPQSNHPHKRWIEFFIEERLEKQIALARNSGAINNSAVQQFNNLFNLLPDLIPDEKPSLLHGDLWSGNYMTSTDGVACLIDPAVYYGHREMDLAMSKLFGGFPGEFYESYMEEFPLSPGFESRVDIHNLYPLLVHVNLFGGSYAQQVESILSRF